ncbi:MAG: VWA domain-containing protein [Deltaproteobacteria bacterium]|jgi:hypothetical protein|nr:VWA domain-containing protein [Deltaproteobacteria bacterium]MBW2536677.1 VWA domain-containing protein [Deltaproteobacteria bacterium]
MASHIHLHSRTLKRLLPAFVAMLVLALGSPLAWAAPEAHILRIDPRASMVDGAPILTTVVELVQHKRMTDITSRCAALTGNAQLDCMADALEKPQALYSPFGWPEKNAILTVTVDGIDMPANFQSHARWGDSGKEDGVGTAWLIVVDAAASMGSRFSEAKALAKGFVNAMGPQDIVDVMFFNDRAVVKDSKWLDKKGSAASFIDSVAGTYPKQGRSRPLFNIIKQAATDGFKELGNAGNKIAVPMHQAMVVLSNGSAGSDPGSPAAAALGLRQYLTKGRFPEDNQTLPKAPVPVVSVWFPAREMEEFYQNAREFMENLANTEIGGAYFIVRDGQSGRANSIVKAVRMRYDQMHLVKWRVSCIAPSINQTFKLLFKNTNPPIAGDNFVNVPVGIDPSTWPLDIDVEATMKHAKKNKVHPGGEIKIFGTFCWGSDAKRAQLYMIPKNQPAPASLKGSNLEDAKAAQKKLTQSGMVGKAVSAGDTFVEFEVPDTTKFLSGKGNKMNARLVVLDSRAYRTSAITSDKILTLPAEEKPFNLMLIGGLTFGGVVLLLLVIQIFRGGGRRRRGGAPPAAPPPVVAGGGPPMGGPQPPGPGGYPQGGGYPPPGGGYPPS